MPEILSRLLIELFPPEEIKQFNLHFHEFFERNGFQPRLHAYNPLIPLKQAVLIKLQSPEEIIEQVQSQSITVEHYFLLCLTKIVNEMMSDARLHIENNLLNGEAGRVEQTDEFFRLLSFISSLMEQRGYADRL